MKLHRRVWVLLAVTGVASLFGSGDAKAYPPRRGYVAPYAYSVPVYSYYYYQNPYVMPLPGYGILPLPLASMNYYYGQNYGGFSAVDDFGSTTDRLDYTPRKRAGLYPAVPYEKADVRLVDAKRVRFEITVPYADALVKFDGVTTKQTGLNRVFMTPPLQEDKEYTITIAVQWTKQDGTLTLPRQKMFTVVAGETLQHTFIE